MAEPSINNATQLSVKDQEFDDFPFIAGGHHQVVRDQVSGSDIHTFAIAGPPVYLQDDEDQWEFDCEIPVGAVIFLIHGKVNLASDWLDADVSVRVPNFGTFKLGGIHGDLKSGITLDINLHRILSGSIKFVTVDHWLCAELKVSIFKTKYGPTTIRLIPLPAGSGMVFSFPWLGVVEWMKGVNPPTKVQLVGVIFLALVAQGYQVSHENYNETKPDGTKIECTKFNIGPKKKLLQDDPEASTLSVPPALQKDWSAAVKKAGKNAIDRGIKEVK